VFIGHRHFPKAALTDRFEQLVPADYLGRGFLDSRFDYAGPLPFQGGSRQEAAAGKMLLEQFVHLRVTSLMLIQALRSHPVKIENPG